MAKNGYFLAQKNTFLKKKRVVLPPNFLLLRKTQLIFMYFIGLHEVMDYAYKP